MVENHNPNECSQAKPPTPPPVKDFYTAFVALGVHGQENKWWMLYIFLVFNSILVLSCSTILVANNYRFLHQVVLTLLCAAGLFIAVCWLFMVPDYVRASNLYSNIARDAEAGLPAGVGRPLTVRDEQRAEKYTMGTMRFVATAMPLLFGIVYIILLVLAWSSFGERPRF